jgi:hypothetical protein
MAMLLMLLVPLSRLYLGVHFPTDLVGGYWLGALMLFVAIGPALRIEAWLRSWRPGWQLAAAVALPSILMQLSLNTVSVTVMSTLMGFGIGLIAENRWVRFECDGNWLKRGVRLLLGATVLLIVWAVLRRAWAPQEAGYLSRFVRYALAGLWAAWGAPWTFVRLGLAGRRLGAPGFNIETKGDDRS